jgi:hypothetical protein
MRARPRGERREGLVVDARPGQDTRVRLAATVLGETFTFASVKEVLARANEPRSGDEQAGLAPRSMREMAAAKRVLAALTVKDLRENPSVPYELDEVTRVVGTPSPSPRQSTRTSASAAGASRSCASGSSTTRRRAPRFAR